MHGTQNTAEATAGQNEAPPLRVKDLELRYGETLILREVTFSVSRGEIFVIMGCSGCGKSTLLKHLIGLYEPVGGSIFYGDVNFWEAGETERRNLMRRVGVLYQQGALWTSLTLAENIIVPLEEYTDLPIETLREVASLKLALVGLAGFEEFTPSEISGGMRRRAALARAMALDPEILFFDEPSAGLDPVSAARLDELILQLRDSLGSTIVVVSHDLASIFAIADTAVLLEGKAQTIVAAGDPATLKAHSRDPRVQRFLTRGTQQGPRTSCQHEEEHS